MQIGLSFAKTLWYPAIGKHLLVKVNTSFSLDLWLAICRQWYAWGQSSLQNSFLPVISWAASVRRLTGWLLLKYSSEVRFMNFLRRNKSRNFPFDFICAKIGMVYWGKKIVLIPKRCKSAKPIPQRCPLWDWLMSVKSDYKQENHLILSIWPWILLVECPC